MKRDLGKLCLDALREHSLLPDQLFDRLTPHQVVMMLFRTGDPASKHIDRDGDLARINHTRAAKGEQPIIPSWMWPTVPRAR